MQFDRFNFIKSQFKNDNEQLESLSDKHRNQRLKFKAKIAQLEKLINSKTENGELITQVVKLESELCMSEQENHLLKNELNVRRDDREKLMQVLKELKVMRCKSIESNQSDCLDFQSLHAQMIYKDNKILELNNLILERERQILDLQEMYTEKEEVVDAKMKAIRIMRQKCLMNECNTKKECSTETEENMFSSNGTNVVSLYAHKQLSPGHAVALIKTGYGECSSPPPLDPSEDQSSIGTDNEFKLERHKHRKKVTFDLPPPLKRSDRSALNAVDDGNIQSKAAIAQATIDLVTENDQLRQIIQETESHSENVVKPKIAMLEADLAAANRAVKTTVLRTRALGQSQLRDLMCKIASMEKNFNNEMESHREREKLLENDRRMILLENSKLLHQIDSFRTEIEELRAECGERSRESEKLLAKSKEDENLILRLADDLEEKHSVIDSLLQQKNSIFEDVQRLKEVTEAFKDYINLLENDILIYEENIGALRGTLNVSKNNQRVLIKSKAFNIKLSALDKENKHISQINSDQGLRVQAMKSRIRMLDEENNQFLNDVNNFKAMLSNFYNMKWNISGCRNKDCFNHVINDLQLKQNEINRLRDRILRYENDKENTLIQYNSDELNLKKKVSELRQINTNVLEHWKESNELIDTSGIRVNCYENVCNGQPLYGMKCESANISKESYVVPSKSTNCDDIVPSNTEKTKSVPFWLANKSDKVDSADNSESIWEDYPSVGEYSLFGDALMDKWRKVDNLVELADANCQTDFSGHKTTSSCCTGACGQNFSKISYLDHDDSEESTSDSICEIHRTTEVQRRGASCHFSGQYREGDFITVYRNTSLTRTTDQNVQTNSCPYISDAINDHQLGENIASLFNELIDSSVAKLPTKMTDSACQTDLLTFSCGTQYQHHDFIIQIPVNVVGEVSEPTSAYFSPSLGSCSVLGGKVDKVEIRKDKRDIILCECVDESAESFTTEDISRLMTLNYELETAVDVLNAELWSLKRKMREMLADREHSLNEIDEMKNSFEKYEAYLENREKELEAMKERAEGLLQQVTLCESEKSQLQIEYVNKCSENEKYVTHLEDAYKLLNDYYAQLQAAYNDLYAGFFVPKCCVSASTDLDMHMIEETTVVVAELKESLAKTKVEFINYQSLCAKKLNHLNCVIVNLRDHELRETKDLVIGFINAVQSSFYDILDDEKIHYYLQANIHKNQVKHEHHIKDMLYNALNLGMDASKSNLTMEQIVNLLKNIVSFRRHTTTDKSASLKIQSASLPNLNLSENFEEADNAAFSTFPSASEVLLYNFTSNDVCKGLWQSNFGNVYCPTKSQMDILAARLLVKIADNNALFRCNTELVYTNLSLQNKVDILNSQLESINSVNGSYENVTDEYSTKSTQTAQICLVDGNGDHDLLNVDCCDFGCDEYESRRFRSANDSLSCDNQKYSVNCTSESRTRENAVQDGDQSRNSRSHGRILESYCNDDDLIALENLAFYNQCNLEKCGKDGSVESKTTNDGWNNNSFDDQQRFDTVFNFSLSQITNITKTQYDQETTTDQNVINNSRREYDDVIEQCNHQGIHNRVPECSYSVFPEVFKSPCSPELSGNGEGIDQADRVEIVEIMCLPSSSENEGDLRSNLHSYNDRAIDEGCDNALWHWSDDWHESEERLKCKEIEEHFKFDIESNGKFLDQNLSGRLLSNEQHNELVNKSQQLNETGEKYMEKIDELNKELLIQNSVIEELRCSNEKLFKQLSKCAMDKNSMKIEIGEKIVDNEDLRQVRETIDVEKKSLKKQNGLMKGAENEFVEVVYESGEKNNLLECQVKELRNLSDLNEELRLQNDKLLEEVKVMGNMRRLYTEHIQRSKAQGYENYLYVKDVLGKKVEEAEHILIGEMARISSKVEQMERLVKKFENSLGLYSQKMCKVDTCFAVDFEKHGGDPVDARFSGQNSSIRASVMENVGKRKSKRNEGTMHEKQENNWNSKTILHNKDDRKNFLYRNELRKLEEIYGAISAVLGKFLDENVRSSNGEFVPISSASDSCIRHTDKYAEIFSLLSQLSLGFEKVFSAYCGECDKLKIV